ncbi:Guanine deaminase [Roseibaca ekhonensis]|jgi:guanine deaminase|uniref:Guanine deaminase n=1 Tax=Roseinatronobacter ekhonensis TaxID=254356 RepID=A0A3B0M881_9RHOB|nr:guanine deaminase [Roseibaca ekhonensis]SUZ31610.1 Guanine deaminase [Roseibaca ekhonensis]
MTRTLIRARLLTFHREPQTPDDTGAFTYIEDGALLVEGGMIRAMGGASTIKAEGAQIIDHRPHLLMPGFIDTHLHFPQTQVIASWAAELLDWLNDYTFPEETRYADPALCATMAGAFLDRLTDHGTTTAVAYASVHASSADALFAEAHKRNMRLITGKVMMDRNAPDALCDTPQSSYDDSKALIARWHGVGRLGYAITPRFAITSTPAQLEAAQSLAAEHPDCHIQTHLSENHAEIALSCQLYPDATDYTDIYARYGLLRENSLLGHCIHLSDREIWALADAGAKPVFCPTSNLFLGSGLFNDAKLRAAGLTNGIATDIGGGTSYSLLTTLAEGYKVLQLQGQRLHPYRAFDWITRGNAEALGLADRIGTLDPGTEADFVVLDARATQAMAQRMDRARGLADELFTLQVMGCDRAVVQTYVAGQQQKPL